MGQKQEMPAETLERLKDGLRIISRNEGWIPDQEAFDLFQQIVPWPAVEVCLVNDHGELLLHHRHFKEWPGEYGKIHDWYIPGGFVKVGGTIEEWCQKHIAKDGVTAEIEFLDVCGVIKRAPGEHPTGFPISIACVCKLKGEISFRSGTEENFRFVDETVPTAVPNHTKLQNMFFQWRDRNTHLFSR